MAWQTPQNMKDVQFLTHIHTHTRVCRELTILYCCAAVPGATTQNLLPRLGATVVYSFVVMNGAKNLTTSSNFTLSTSPATGNLTCQNDANQTITSGSLLAYPLAPGANITCYLAVIVSSSHQSAGKITGFPVTASFTGGEGLYVVPLASTVDVPVAAGAAAGVPTASFPLANATLKNFIAGE